MTSSAPCPISHRTKAIQKVADRSLLMICREVCRFRCRRAAVGKCCKDEEVPWPRPSECTEGGATAWAGATPSEPPFRGPDFRSRAPHAPESPPPTQTIVFRATTRRKGR
jgi:hypothetical protein